MNRSIKKAIKLTGFEDGKQNKTKQKDFNPKTIK